MLLLFIFILFNSCQYFTLLGQKEWRKESGNDDVDIYISGYRYYDPGNSSIACYWKIGEDSPIDLEEGNPGGAFQIKIYGNDIYICGVYNDVVGSTNTKACYWKNGKIVKLDCPYSNSFAASIAIADGLVYVCGQYWSGGIEYACYWINGVFHYLDSTFGSAARAIFFESVSNIVLIAGYYDDDVTAGIQSHACYWKDGVLFSLPDNGTGYSDSFGIAYKGKDLYMCGYNYDNITTNQRACYWKNGVKAGVDITNSVFYAMKIIDNDIYYSEQYDGGGCRYWKNDNVISLPYPSGGSGDCWIRSVYSFNSALYICGYTLDAAPDYHTCWWKDGKTMGFLEDYNTNESNAIDIAVKYK